MGFQNLFHQIKNGVVNSIHRRPLNSAASIRLTRLCTQRCRQCDIYNQRTNPPFLSLDDFRMIAAKLRDYGAYIGVISGGEPSLVPQLEGILLESKKTFPLAISLLTGLYDRREKVERMANIALDNNISIQASLDGLGELGDYLRGVKGFSRTVIQHMGMISEQRERIGSKSLLSFNIVINNLNLEQTPKIIDIGTDVGWKPVIDFYRFSTRCARRDEELILRPGKELDKLVEFLMEKPEVLALDSFLKGIGDFLNGRRGKICAYLDAPILATRTHIMEDGSVHLCRGEAIGNIFKEDLKDIFNGDKYHQRLAMYKECEGCWATCYTEGYLLTHPRSLKEFIDVMKKLWVLRQGASVG